MNWVFEKEGGELDFPKERAPWIGFWRKGAKGREGIKLHGREFKELGLNDDFFLMQQACREIKVKVLKIYGPKSYYGRDGYALRSVIRWFDDLWTKLEILEGLDGNIDPSIGDSCQVSILSLLHSVAQAWVLRSAIDVINVFIQTFEKFHGKLRCLDYLAQYCYTLIAYCEKEKLLRDKKTQKIGEMSVYMVLNHYCFHLEPLTSCSCLS